MKFSISGVPAIFLAIFLAISASAQSPNANDTSNQPTVNSTPGNLTEQAKSSNEELLTLQEAAVKRATDSVTQLRQLYAEGLIARVELEKSEKELVAATNTLEQTRTQIANSERLSGEIQKAAQLARAKPLVKLTSMSRTASVLRAPGTPGLSLAANLSSVEQFFQRTFKRSLPTSAIGQSATHNKLGWDHRNSFDIGVHPDSQEGVALMSYLKISGIPFLAFRAAIPGVATGPHIHVGNPSHRLG